MTDTLIARRAEDYLDAVDGAVEEVYRFAHEKAQYLASTVGGDPEYYMAMMFQRYAFLHPMPKRTSYYMSRCMERCDIVSEEPSRQNVAAQREFLAEFQNLTGDQKDALLALVELEKDANRNFLAIRTDPPHRATEVGDTFDLIKALVHVSVCQCRCGIDGFVCIVKNNDAYSLPPQWFFTSQDINQYLSTVMGRWDARTIGRRLEAFAMFQRSSDRVVALPSSRVDE